jgi:hypothetical protein
MSTNNTSSSNQPPAITDANAPFDDPDTDAILRSSDNVDFRVFRQFLSYASPVFRAMFALPQASQGDNSNETKDGLPIIHVSEESKTLGRLLLMCYPDDESPPIETLEDVHALLDAAVKYNMERVEKKVRKRLVAQCFLGTDAVHVFAIACCFHLREEAKAAARSTVGQSIIGKPLAKELDLVTGRQMCELLHCHEKCIERTCPLTPLTPLGASLAGIVELTEKQPYMVVCWNPTCNESQALCQTRRGTRRRKKLYSKRH